MAVDVLRSAAACRTAPHGRCRPRLPSDPDDIPPVSPHPAERQHRVPLWHDRGAGASTRLSTRVIGVPDTVNGRLDMIMLHWCCCSAGCESEAEPVRRLGQACSMPSAATWTTICARWGSAIWPCRAGCAGSARRSTAAPGGYEAALDGARPGPLAAALARNVFAGAPEPAGAARLAAYVRLTVRRAGRPGRRRAGAGRRSPFPTPSKVCRALAARMTANEQA